MRTFVYLVTCCLTLVKSRDEDKIMKSCYWPNEIYDPCFGGCAEVSCDNPRNHLRPCYPYCEPGCVCEEPYIRDDRTHQCVLPQDCTPTQMGIPIPNKRSSKQSSQYMEKPAASKHNILREDNLLTEFRVHDGFVSKNHLDEDLKTPEVSRLGNYFNFVIAPPPAFKTIQPRKLLQTDTFEKRI